MKAKACAFVWMTGALAGCGTYVPEIQEFPQGERDGQMLTQQIVANVKCEVQDALAKVYEVKNYRTFLDNWGVQMTVNFTIDEKSAANPVVNWLPPSPASAIFNLGAGATLSSGATRIDKVSFFYTVPELRLLQECDPRYRPGGPMLMQSDLKLREWIFDNLSFSGSGAIRYSRNTPNGPFKQSVISHEVRFEVLTSGSITPGFRLVRASINQSGSLLSASRTRTHSLLITLGPVEPLAPQLVAYRRPQLVGPSRAAADSHLSSEIGLAVSSGLRNAFPQ